MPKVVSRETFSHIIIGPLPDNLKPVYAIRLVIHASDRDDAHKTAYTDLNNQGTREQMFLSKPEIIELGNGRWEVTAMVYKDALLCRTFGNRRLVN